MLSLEEAQSRFDAGEKYLRYVPRVGKVTKSEASIARPMTPDMPAHHAGERKPVRQWQRQEKDVIDHLLDGAVWFLEGLIWWCKEP